MGRRRRQRGGVNPLVALKAAKVAKRLIPSPTVLASAFLAGKAAKKIAPILYRRYRRRRRKQRGGSLLRSIVRGTPLRFLF